MAVIQQAESVLITIENENALEIANAMRIDGHSDWQLGDTARIRVEPPAFCDTNPKDTLDGIPRPNGQTIKEINEAHGELTKKILDEEYRKALTARYPDRASRYVEGPPLTDKQKSDAPFSNMLRDVGSKRRLIEHYWLGRMEAPLERIIEDKYRPEELVAYKPVMQVEKRDTLAESIRQMQELGPKGEHIAEFYTGGEFGTIGASAAPSLCHCSLSPIPHVYSPGDCRTAGDDMRDEAYRRINVQARIATLKQMEQQEAGKDAAKMQAEHDPGCAEAKCWCRE